MDTPKPMRVQRILVQPATEGLKVPIPGRPGQYLPDDGALVPFDSYWLRRLKDGDVVTTATMPASGELERIDPAPESETEAPADKPKRTRRKADRSED